MSVLDFLRRKKTPEKKIPTTLDEVPYPGTDGYMNLRNTEMTKEILDILPEFLKIEGLGEIIRSTDWTNKNGERLWGIFHGSIDRDRSEPKLDEPVQKFLDVAKRHLVFKDADRNDRTSVNHLYEIMRNLMWLPPEERLPMLDRIKSGVENTDERSEFELWPDDFSKQLHGYWKKEGYTVEEALNYDPDKPGRHNMNGLMKQLDGVGGRVSVTPGKIQGKVLSDTSHNTKDSGLQI